MSRKMTSNLASTTFVWDAHKGPKPPTVKPETGPPLRNIGTDADAVISHISHVFTELSLGLTDTYTS